MSLFEESHEELLEQINEAVTIGIKTVEKAAEQVLNSAVIPSVAQMIKKLHDELVREGFTHSEALELVSKSGLMNFLQNNNK